MKRPRGDKNRFPAHHSMKGPLKKGRLPELGEDYEKPTKNNRKKK